MCCSKFIEEWSRKLFYTFLKNSRNVWLVYLSIFKLFKNLFYYQCLVSEASECLMYVSLSRSIPSPNTQLTTNYQWPTSPILPPVSSRTPHLVREETLTPSATQQLAITNSAHNNPTHNHHHHKGAGSWIETDGKPSNNDDQFSSTMPASSSSGNDSKYTRQRERASRSLDKY